MIGSELARPDFTHGASTRSSLLQHQVRGSRLIHVYGEVPLETLNHTGVYYAAKTIPKRKLASLVPIAPRSNPGLAPDSLSLLPPSPPSIPTFSREQQNRVPEAESSLCALCRSSGAAPSKFALLTAKKIKSLLHINTQTLRSRNPS